MLASSARAQRRIEEFVRYSSILVLASAFDAAGGTMWGVRGVLLHSGRILTIGPIKEIVGGDQELTEELTAMDAVAAAE